MAQLISVRYATALFELALEKDCIDKYSDEITLIRDAVTEDSEIIRILDHPQISSDEKLNILTSAFEGKVSADIMGLINIVFRKNRETELADILNKYLEMAEKHKGIVYAAVESAYPLKTAAIDEIRTKLSNKLNKQVIVETKVIPELIGGIRISVEGHVIDSTIKTQLSLLKGRLIETRLA